MFFLSPLRFALLTVRSRLRVGSRKSNSLPDNFAVLSANRNMNSSKTYSSGRNFLMRSTFPNLPNPQSEYLLSKFSTRSIHTQRRYQVILSCQIDEVLTNLALKSDDIQPFVEKELIIRPLNGSPNRLSYGVFTSARRSWTFRR